MASIKTTYTYCHCFKKLCKIWDKLQFLQCGHLISVSDIALKSDREMLEHVAEILVLENWLIFLCFKIIIICN